MNKPQSEALKGLNEVKGFMLSPLWRTGLGAFTIVACSVLIWLFVSTNAPAWLSLLPLMGIVYVILSLCGVIKK
jgi:hypothetical protein